MSITTNAVWNWKKLVRDTAGNILPMTAAGTIVLAGLVGGGVDMSRAYMAQNRLQNACDSAVLAGRRMVKSDGFDQAAEDKADAFFETNFDATEQGVRDLVFTATSPDGGDTVVGNATAKIDTAIMQIFKFDTMPLAVTCQASMSIGNSDVVMVLDTTGSMDYTLAGTSETRLEALEDAMKNFYDTTSAAAAGGNGRIRYGFVPFSMTVNVGYLIAAQDPDYLVDEWTYQSLEPEYVETKHFILTGYEDPYSDSDTSAENESYGSWYYYSGTKYSSSNSCNNNRPSDTAWSNSGASYTEGPTTTINESKQRITTTSLVQPQSRINYACFYSNYYGGYFAIYRNETRDYYENDYEIEDPRGTWETTSTFDHFNYKAVERDVSAFKAGTAVSVINGEMVDSSDARYESSYPTKEFPVTQSITWDGCIEERDTVANASFSYNTSSKKITPGNTYDLDIDLEPTGNDATKWRPMWKELARRRTNSSFYATSASVSDYYRYPQVACPVEAQLLSTMDEDDFDDYAESLIADGGTYHDVGMIWGARFLSPDGIFASNVNATPPNNGDVSRHIIYMTDGVPDAGWATYSMYGIEWHDRRVTSDGYSNQNSRHRSRFLAICEATKAKGIRVWVIAFATALTTDLEACASDDSSFPAADADELNDAFQEIAKDVGELRITQ